MQFMCSVGGTNIAKHPANSQPTSKVKPGNKLEIVQNSAPKLKIPMTSLDKSSVMDPKFIKPGSQQSDSEEQVLPIDIGNDDYGNENFVRP